MRERGGGQGWTARASVWLPFLQPREAVRGAGTGLGLPCPQPWPCPGNRTSYGLPKDTPALLVHCLAPSGQPWGGSPQ